MPKPGAVLLIVLATLLAAAPASAAQRPEPRIINGEPAGAGEYPWTVALVETGLSRAFCGGTLIDERIVLTAAHCTISADPDDIQVIVGRQSLTSIPEANRLDVEKISLHPDADPDDDFVPRYDVSLLTLGADATLEGGKVLPLGADETALAATSDLHISGWGATHFSSSPVSQLQQAIVQREDDPACTSIFGGVFFPSDQVCAIGKNPDPDLVIDTCQGDSGGPLAAPPAGPINATDPAGWALMGVTSWGDGCATTYDDGTIAPGVYARVPSPSLRPYIAAATGGTDPGGEQPYLAGGSISADGDPSLDGGGIACGADTLTWGGSTPDRFEYLIRRVRGDRLDTVSTTGSYAFTQGDAGRTFLCEVRARRGGVGGYGLARSGSIVASPATPVAPIQVPVPGEPVLLPGPTVTVFVPQPRIEDDTDPRVTSVKRSCTRRRVCTFTIRASDTGTGVKSIAATLNTVRTRSCRRNGRRTICASWKATALGARKVAGTTSTFRLTTKRLTRGTHVLHARAVDGAGNIQARPRAVSFRLR